VRGRGFFISIISLGFSVSGRIGRGLKPDVKLALRGRPEVERIYPDVKRAVATSGKYQPHHVRQPARDCPSWLPERAEGCLVCCGWAIDSPLALGFGISRREDVASQEGRADMAVIGTANADPMIHQLAA
jgi:hypothetical protein